MLQHAGECQVLNTTRFALQLRFENSVDVDLLPVPSELWKKRDLGVVMSEIPDSDWPWLSVAFAKKQVSICLTLNGSSS